MGGFSIGYGIGISPRTAAFDADALAYFATAGITDSTAQIQINDFVKGIKDLGLWSSMVSWPLRSSQNAGTGTTAYSLGGLGTYNGTLTNGPTWSADGVVFDGSDDYISTTYTPPNGVFSAGVVVDISATFPISRNYIVVSADNGTTQRRFNVFYRSAVGGVISFEANLGGTMASRIAALSLSNNNNTHFAQVGHDGTNFYGQSDLNAIQSAAGAGESQGSGQPLSIGDRPLTSNDAFQGFVSFCYFMEVSVNSNYNNIYLLYKTTLGQGLELP